MKKIYYAHPIYSYGTGEEAQYWEQAQKTFSGYQIVNPSQFQSTDMEFYLRLVYHADAIAYFGQTRGVIAEVYFGLTLHKPVYSLAMKKYISGNDYWELEIRIAFESHASCIGDEKLMHQISLMPF